MKKIKILNIIFIVAVTIFSFAGMVLAWVNINQEVSITDVTVKPAQGESLTIKNSLSSTSFGIIAKPAKSGVSTLKPASTADLKNWFCAASIDGINNSGTFDPTASFTDFLPSKTPTNCFCDEFFIKPTIRIDDLVVSNITVTDDNGNTPKSEYSKSLRVGILVNDGEEKALIYAPIAGADTSYRAISSMGSSPSTESVILSKVGTTKIFDTIGADPEYKVQLFVWFEGQDSHCNSVNLIEFEGLNITIEFSGTPIKN